MANCRSDLVASGLFCDHGYGRHKSQYRQPTWWLGPESNPSFVLLWALPFVAPIASIISAIKFGRIASFVGFGSALFLGAIGVADINNTPGVALIECAIAISSALIAIATFAGRVK